MEVPVKNFTKLQLHYKVQEAERRLFDSLTNDNFKTELENLNHMTECLMDALVMLKIMTRRIKDNIEGES